MQVGQKVYRIKINKCEHERTSSYKTGVFIEENKILGINDMKMCINDLHFSTFYTREKGARKDSYKNYLNETSVSIRTREKYFPNGVFITKYSTIKPTKQMLKSMLSKANKEIDSSYGFLFNGVKTELSKMVESYKIQQ